MNITPTVTFENAPTVAYRPQFALYHPNPKGTGCALKMALHPAHGDADGFVRLTMAPQVSVGDLRQDVPVYPTFDWEHNIGVKLGFPDLCQMLQVFRGETETIQDGKGLFHRFQGMNTRIALRHLAEPYVGYALEVFRSEAGKPNDDRNARIVLNLYEAMGVAMALEHSIGYICFGVPKILPQEAAADQSAAAARAAAKAAREREEVKKSGHAA